jgi:hypothetical protein
MQSHAHIFTTGKEGLEWYLTTIPFSPVLKTREIVPYAPNLII